MLPDRVSNPGPLTYESGALPIALRGPATGTMDECNVFKNLINGPMHETQSLTRSGPEVINELYAKLS